MFKLLRFFAIFFVLHVLSWGAAHWYLSNNPRQVLVVVDTSFAMKPKHPAMRDWLENFESESRYRRVIVGTDKALIGELADLRSKDPIFRTVFGKMSLDSLQRYAASTASEKILLSDGTIEPSGWTVVPF